VARYRGKPEFHQSPNLGDLWYAMNPKVAPFNNLHFRRAIAFAINRDAIVRGVEHNTQIPLAGWYPKGILGYDPTVGSRVPHYDPAVARKELALAMKTMKSVPSIRLEYPSDTEDWARDAVLAAARHAFATRGFERTTVRAVAADAGVDASMVIRYFTSKERLFEAATDVDLALPDLGRVPSAERGQALAERFVALWDDSVTGEVLTLLLRSAPTSERAAERIREVFSTQVRTVITDLADPEHTDGGVDPRTVRRAGALSSHILGTALARYVLRLPPLADAPGEEVVAGLAPVLQHILES